MEIDWQLYRVALVKKGITQERLARLSGVAPATLSGWVRGAYPWPAGALSRVEALLDLPAGSLHVPGIPEPAQAVRSPRTRTAPTGGRS